MARKKFSDLTPLVRAHLDLLRDELYKEALLLAREQGVVKIEEEEKIAEYVTKLVRNMALRVERVHRSEGSLERILGTLSNTELAKYYEKQPRKELSATQQAHLDKLNAERTKAKTLRKAQLTVSKRNAAQEKRKGRFSRDKPQEEDFATLYTKEELKSMSQDMTLSGNIRHKAQSAWTRLYKAEMAEQDALAAG